MEDEQESTLVDSGSGITCDSKGLAAELQGKLAGVDRTRPFLGQAWVQTSFFSPKHNIATQTVPIQRQMSIHKSVVHFEAPFVLLPGDRRLIISGRRP